MRIYLPTLTLAAVLCCAACNRPGNTDAFCRIVENGANPRIKEDDFVALDYTARLDDGSTLYSHYKHLLHRQSADFGNDFYSALGKLGEGDSALVKVSIDSMVKYNQLTRPNGLTGKFINYSLRIKKVITRNGEPGRASDSTLNADIERYKQQSATDDRNREAAMLMHYIAQSKLKFIKTKSGLYYCIEKQGNGAKPQPGDLAQVHFTGGFTDGEIFFTNDSVAARSKGIYSPEKKYQPLEFYMGKGLFIKGIEEGIALMPEGSKAVFVIPSNLGDVGRYGYLPLVCQVEVLRVRHPQPGEAIKMLQEDDHGLEKHH